MKKKANFNVWLEDDDPSRQFLYDIRFGKYTDEEMTVLSTKYVRLHPSCIRELLNLECTV